MKTTIEKPWGYEEPVLTTDYYSLKYLHINRFEETSMKFHKSKHESFYVVSGLVEFVRSDEFGQLEARIMKHGDLVHVSTFNLHQLKALEDSLVLEVSTPEHAGDVFRVQDKYGRPTVAYEEVPKTR